MPASHPPSRDGASPSVAIAQAHGPAQREKDGAGPPLAVFGPGEVVGVVTAILGEPRGATAHAGSPASVLPMTLRELIEAEGGSGQPVAVVLTTLAEKLRELVARLDA